MTIGRAQYLFLSSSAELKFVAARFLSGIEWLNDIVAIQELHSPKGSLWPSKSFTLQKEVKSINKGLPAFFANII